MFMLDINTDNAAFGETDTEQAYEVARLLKLAASQLERGAREGLAVDQNGNRCGYWKLKRR